MLSLGLSVLSSAKSVSLHDPRMKSGWAVAEPGAGVAGGDGKPSPQGTSTGQ